jgi:methyl-accepting chemotaxis protein
MPSNDIAPPPERAADSYSKLAAVAKELNCASDELGKTVAEFDEALKKLNLGVTVWVKLTVRGPEPQNDFWEESDELGYAKIKGKWGIAIRTVSEDIQNHKQLSEEQWLFHDAPRALRLAAIDKFAELLDALTTKATKTKDEIRQRLSSAQAVAEAVTKASGRIPSLGLTPPHKKEGAE